MTLVEQVLGTPKQQSTQEQIVHKFFEQTSNEIKNGFVSLFMNYLVPSFVLYLVPTLAELLMISHITYIFGDYLALTNYVIPLTIGIDSQVICSVELLFEYKMAHFFTTMDVQAYAKEAEIFVGIAIFVMMISLVLQLGISISFQVKNEVDPYTTYLWIRTFFQPLQQLFQFGVTSIYRVSGHRIVLITLGIFPAIIQFCLESTFYTLNIEYKSIWPSSFVAILNTVVITAIQLTYLINIKVLGVSPQMILEIKFSSLFQTFKKSLQKHVIIILHSFMISLNGFYAYLFPILLTMRIDHLDIYKTDAALKAKIHIFIVFHVGNFFRIGPKAYQHFISTVCSSLYQINHRYFLFFNYLIYAGIIVVIWNIFLGIIFSYTHIVSLLIPISSVNTAAIQTFQTNNDFDGLWVITLIGGLLGVSEIATGLALSFKDYYFCFLNGLGKIFILVLVTFQFNKVENYNIVDSFIYVETVGIFISLLFIVIYYVKYRTMLLKQDIKYNLSKQLTYEQEISTLK